MADCAWRELAKLAVARGIHLQPGQRVCIQSPVEYSSFVHLLAEEAYQQGAQEVCVRWEDQTLSRMRSRWAPEDRLATGSPWSAGELTEIAREGGCIITVRAPYQYPKEDIPTARAALAQKTERMITQEALTLRMSGHCTWTIVLLPTVGWARKVYPQCTDEQAMDRLTQTLFQCSRVEPGRTLENWREHRAHLEQYANYLTGRSFRALRYWNQQGTDLTVGLADGHRWCGGGVYKADGLPFIPNIPTEELGTAPRRDSANGTVVTTMPFLFEETLIEGMRLVFRDGVVVEYHADRGEDALRRLLETDAGGQSRRLGEVALVPISSPIAQTHTLFYNTLLDENASCHLALGNGYPFCLQGGEALSPEDMDRAGLNTGSLLHVDFMIGSPDLSVDGQNADGSWSPVFRNGTWAFSL